MFALFLFFVALTFLTSLIGKSFSNDELHGFYKTVAITGLLFVASAVAKYVL